MINYHLLVLTAWIAARASAIGAATCDCNAYFSYTEASGLNRCPLDMDQESLSSLTFTVRTPEHAEVLCSSFAQVARRAGHTCTRFQLTRLDREPLEISSNTVQTMDVYEVVVFSADAARYADSFGTLCPPHTRIGRLVQNTRMMGYFDPQSKCRDAVCPEAALAATSVLVPTDLQRFVNQDSLICNIAACPECACVPATKQCTCSQLFAGTSCQYYKPQYCCSPADPFAHPNISLSHVCTETNMVGTSGLCGFDSEYGLSRGAESCYIQPGADGPPQCHKCRPDRMRPLSINRREALTGPRCNQSACAYLGGGGCAPPRQANTCLSVCTTPLGTQKWCYQCTMYENCTQSGAACQCEKSDAALYLGPRCEVRATGSPAFTAINWEDGSFTGGSYCQTQLPGAYTAWYDLPYGAVSAAECAGHGHCRYTETQDRNRICDCDPGYLLQTRCFSGDRCLTECNPRRATCNYPESNVLLCTCMDPYWTAALPPPAVAPTSLLNQSTICAMDGCSGSLIIAGQIAGIARWDAQQRQCHCPTNIQLPNGHVFHSTWQQVRTATQQGRVGCRVQCPFSDQGECGDNRPGRCSDSTAWLEPNMNWNALPQLTCNCESNQYNGGELLPMRILNASTGSCDLFCVHGRDETSQRDRRRVCVCYTGNRKVGAEIQQLTLWAGPRCDVSRCLYGSVWSAADERCNCDLAVPPHNRVQNPLDDIWCATGGCRPPRTVWNATLGDCTCPLGTRWEAGECRLPCLLPGGYWSEGRCNCIAACYAGPACQSLLCEHGNACRYSPARGNFCNCTGTTWTDRYCNVSRCLPPRATGAASLSTCKCASSFLSGQYCETDQCSSQFPETGRAIWDPTRQEWNCKCALYVPHLEDGTCGCPPWMEIDVCSQTDVYTDDRCALVLNATTRGRCICAKGFKAVLQPNDPENTIHCEEEICNAQGRVVEKPLYEKVDGSWRCRCKPGWTGLECQVRQDTQRCGNGTRMGTNTCKCDTRAFLATDPIQGTICVLDCRHEGRYELVTTSCICPYPYTGPICEHRIVPVESSTGGGTEYTSSTGTTDRLQQLYRQLVAAAQPAMIGALPLGAFLFILLGILLLVALFVRWYTGSQASSKDAAASPYTNADKHA